MRRWDGGQGRVHIRKDLTRHPLAISTTVGAEHPPSPPSFLFDSRGSSFDSPIVHFWCVGGGYEGGEGGGTRGGGRERKGQREKGWYERSSPTLTPEPSPPGRGGAVSPQPRLPLGGVFWIDCGAARRGKDKTGRRGRCGSAGERCHSRSARGRRGATEGSPSGTPKVVAAAHASAGAGMWDKEERPSPPPTPPPFLALGQA